MQLSKLEDLAYKTLKKNNLVTFKVKDLQLLLNINKTKTYNLVKALKKKDIIKRVGKRFLAFSEANDFSTATIINSPSYISFWSALNFYGFSDQMPKLIFSAAVKRSPVINNFKYVTLSKNRFFGYTLVDGITIAEKEKAIIDSILFPKYAGGIKEVIRCTKSALNEINVNKLINYALKINSKAVLRRLGFILEELKVNGKILKELEMHIGKGYELLDPSLKRTNNFNKKWLLDVNY